MKFLFIFSLLNSPLLFANCDWEIASEKIKIFYQKNYASSDTELEELDYAFDLNIFYNSKKQAYIYSSDDREGPCIVYKCQYKHSFEDESFCTNSKS